MTSPSPRPKLTRPRPAVAQPTGKAAPTRAGVRRPVAERIAPEDALLICFYKPYGVLSQFTPRASGKASRITSTCPACMWPGGWTRTARACYC